MHEQLDAQLAVLSRLATRARSQASRLAWRTAEKRRSSRIASVLRQLPGLVPGKTVSRSRVEAVWIVSVEEPSASIPVMTLQIHTSPRTLGDLAKPLAARLLRRDLIDVHVLERLESQGLIRVVTSETT